MKRKIFKKVLSFILVLGIIFTLGACSLDAVGFLNNDDYTGTKSSETTTNKNNGTTTDEITTTTSADTTTTTGEVREKNAYEIAVENGYEGSLDEWLNDLVKNNA